MSCLCRRWWKAGKSREWPASAEVDIRECSHLAQCDHGNTPGPSLLPSAPANNPSPDPPVSVSGEVRDIPNKPAGYTHFVSQSFQKGLMNFVFHLTNTFFAVVWGASSAQQLWSASSRGSCPLAGLATVPGELTQQQQQPWGQPPGCSKLTWGFLNHWPSTIYTRWRCDPITLLMSGFLQQLYYLRQEEC